MEDYDKEIIEDSINETIEEDRKQFPQLMRRIKAGKRWLIENRLEVLQSKGLGKTFNFTRWMDNHSLYLDLYEEAYLKGLVGNKGYDLFNPEFIEDLMPMLKKIFEAKRFEDALI
jgi:hypothetical protein